MRASEMLVRAYLRNMNAVQKNGQLSHQSSLFERAMKWCTSDEQDKGSPPIHFLLGIGLNIGANPRRKENEDYVFADSFSLPNGVQETVGIFVVADGVGGSINGQEASRLAVHTFVETVYSQLCSIDPLHCCGSVIKDLLLDGIRAANEAVYQRNQELQADMASTFVAGVSVGREVYVVGVGDSRGYIYREGVGMQQLTQDHSYVAEQVRRGALDRKQVFTHPKRNEIYRALGAASVMIDEPVALQLMDGDVLLLCSDGLWEMVRDPDGADIAEILAKRQLSAQDMAQQLVRLALEGGGHDNIGICVAKAQVNIAAYDTLIFPLDQTLVKKW